MLDVIKEVLIKQKQQELKQRSIINKRMKEISKEESQENFEEIDRELGLIESKIANLKMSFFKRVFNSKKLNGLYDEYRELSHIKLNKMKKFNDERNELLEKLYHVTHNEILIEREIERIKNATSLAELDITDVEAMELLKSHFNDDNLAIIKTVFSNIKNNRNITTRDDVFKSMQGLYQTNVSSFVVAMKKVSPDEFISTLLDIGIVIDDDKVSFLNSLSAYILEPSGDLSQVIRNLGREDRLDTYYYNEIEKVLANMLRYSGKPDAHLSYIMSLAALVSMAKANKLESKKEK